jgi:transposase
VQRKIQEEWGIRVSKETIKRVIKEARMGWRRIRRRPGRSPDPEDYAQKVKELEELRQQELRGEIEIRYVDETGFCLTPYVPYAWQEVGEKIEVKSQRSQRLNVLGFLTRKNELEAYLFKGSITKEVVTACIDKFCEGLKKKTVLVMDNSSVHQNHLFWEKQESWASKGLEIFFLPTYSPQLNIIEIFWRFIKYQWLEFNAYESYSNLVEAVESIIKNFGSEYTINFA